ncbi:MAG: hypothetical protein MUP81_06435 [Dehalococcoidia bacterium]|nr:hypothetical protein [Dehalococcoidia bacterium]
MGETNSLLIFTQASRMLAEADTIQKTKELKDLALTAADWAKRKGMGEEAIQYARSYAFEAERKMGQLLTIDPDIQPGGDRKSFLHGDRMKLANLNLTFRESAEAQKLAELSEEEFEAVKVGEK